LEELHGLLGLVEEEDEMVGLVEAADGLVRVVCPNTDSETNEKAAAANKQASRCVCRAKLSSAGQFSQIAKSRSDDFGCLLDASVE
jgi:hypothetical protein